MCGSTASAAPARKVRPRRHGRYALPRSRPRACGIPVDSATPAPGGAARRARTAAPRPGSMTASGARARRNDSNARCARVWVMPCRSSRPSISFRPRDSCERSRRPRGASGGGLSGLRFLATRASADDFGPVADFAATNVSSTIAATGAFAARAFFRSGLICFATLSHKTRSSSLKARLRRAAANDSGIGGGGRFIA